MVVKFISPLKHLVPYACKDSSQNSPEVRYFLSCERSNETVRDDLKVSYINDVFLKLFWRFRDKPNITNNAPKTLHY